MTMKRTGYRPGQTPGVGVAQAKLLRVLRAASYRGPVSRLAKLIGFTEGSAWLAVAGLAGKGLVVAERVDTGVFVRITEQGRRVGRG